VRCSNHPPDRLGDETQKHPEESKGPERVSLLRGKKGVRDSSAKAVLPLGQGGPKRGGPRRKSLTGEKLPAKSVHQRKGNIPRIKEGGNISKEDIINKRTTAHTSVIPTIDENVE